MYEPSRNLANFFIAGFKHYEGALVMDQLHPGLELTMEAQPDNPHDASAIALKLGSTMLGYVPAGLNEPFATLFHYGHADAFECRVLQVTPQNDPWEQARVAIFVKDARTSE